MQLFCYLICAIVVGFTKGETFGWSSWSLSTSRCHNESRSRTRVTYTRTSSCESCFERSSEMQTELCDTKTKSVTNLALKRRATSSSVFGVFPYGRAELAVDGNTNGNFKFGSCMHTGLDFDPWLRIDLGKIFHVKEVIVYNRVDCCASRADGLTVTIEQKRNVSHTSCGMKIDMRSRAVKFDCPEYSYGRFVKLSTSGYRYLHLCEVEVFGVDEVRSCHDALRNNPGKSIVDTVINTGSVFEKVSCRYWNGEVYAMMDHNSTQLHHIPWGPGGNKYVAIRYQNSPSFVEWMVQQSETCNQTFHVRSYDVNPDTVYFETIDGTRTVPSSSNCHGCENVFINNDRDIEGYAYINTKVLLPLKGLFIGDIDQVAEFVDIFFQKLACKEK